MTETLQLDQIRAGGIVKLLGFARCRRNGLRLAELGLTPGTRVEVLQASPGQPLLLRVRGTQLAIDRVTAHKICVELISGEHSDQMKERGRREKRGKGPGRLGRNRRRRSHRRGSSADQSGATHEGESLNG